MLVPTLIYIYTFSLLTFMERNNYIRNSAQLISGYVELENDYSIIRYLSIKYYLRNKLDFLLQMKMYLENCIVKEQLLINKIIEAI